LHYQQLHLSRSIHICTYNTVILSLLLWQLSSLKHVFFFRNRLENIPYLFAWNISFGWYSLRSDAHICVFHTPLSRNYAFGFPHMVL
jgi:hypothetical protein